jgi:flagellar basal body-associated protein FliL
MGLDFLLMLLLLIVIVLAVIAGVGLIVWAGKKARGQI